MSDETRLADALELIATLAERCDFAGAVAAADAWLRIYPREAELWRLRAVCLLQSGQFDPARESLMRAIDIAPDSVDALCNLASLHSMEGDSAASARVSMLVLQRAAEHPAALFNLGLQSVRQGNHDAATAWFERAVRAEPGYLQAWLNLANAQLNLHRWTAAEAAARQALVLQHDSADAWFLLGLIFDRQERIADSVAAYERSLECEQRARTAHNLALILDRSGALTAAVPMYERALRLEPELHAALAQLAITRRRLCWWEGLDAISARLLAVVAAGAEGPTPFSFLAEPGASPALQLKCAGRFADDVARGQAARAARLDFQHPAQPGAPLRVGYFSAGFGDHPTALLLVDAIEHLRGGALVNVAFATTADDNSPLRRRLRAAFHEFHDVSGQPVEQVARFVHAQRLDVLIDIDGYCAGSMPGVFALRPAPIQVNWLAYPGSLGGTCYDYIVADGFVIPPNQRAAYSESVARLPRCFQPSDTRRVVAEPPSRAECGLPQRGFVYGCFNNSYKLSPRSFAAWMRILGAVPDSVLWLLDGPAGGDISQRLREYARAASIDPARLHVMPRLPHAHYLARYRHVGLFLDTLPYNAHTTASDAVWAGCPVLTQPGDSFAARVAGSINYHLGLAELNAADETAYVEHATAIGRDPRAAVALRERVEARRRDSDLFDMTGYARDFECLLKRMAARRSDGLRPADLPAVPGRLAMPPG